MTRTGTIATGRTLTATLGSAKNRRRIGAAASHTVLILASLIILIPFLYGLWISLSPFTDITARGFQFNPTPAHYEGLFGRGSRIPALLVNSIVVSLAATLLSLAIGSLSAYAIGRFSWSRWVTVGILGWLIVVQTLPAIALVGPYYTLARQSGLYDTRFVLVLVYILINLPLVIWMMLAYFQGLPRELEEAGVIDGMTPWQIYLYIMVPLSAPALAASGVIAFIFSWKEFLMALSLTSTPSAMTLPVGIAGFVQDYSIQYGPMAAASTIAVIPGLLLAMFAQRHIVSGLTTGAMKQ